MTDLERDFELFWMAYPRRKAKGAARKAFLKAIKITNIKTICDGALNYAAENQHTDGRFIKHPATWLNQGCWDDEPDRDSFADTDAEDSRRILETVFGPGGLDAEHGRTGERDNDSPQISGIGLQTKHEASGAGSESCGNQKVIEFRPYKQNRSA